MNLTVGECTENRLSDALILARRCFQKTEAPLQSRRGRDTFLRSILGDKTWHAQVERGEMRLFGAFDGEHLCGCCLMKQSHILHLCIESRYRRSDAGPLLLDYLRTICPDMTASVLLTEAELFRTCGFIEEKTEEENGLKRILMRSQPTALTHEIWDLRDEVGEPTGRYASRDQYRSLRSGEYMLAVHIFLHTPDGRFLIQKRSMKKDVLPGIWDITGGAAKVGEDGRQAAIRETKEEVGLSLSPDHLHLAARLKRKRSFVELWFARLPIDPRTCVLQEGEVDAVKLVSKREMLNLIQKAKHRDAIYKQAVAKVMNEIK